VEHIQDLFVAARDEIEYAKEEAETVYFNESVAEARAAVEACLSAWNGLLAQLGDAEKAKLQRSMGLKMEQLKVGVGVCYAGDMTVSKGDFLIRIDGGEG
jgi:hypothetical protein